MKLFLGNAGPFLSNLFNGTSSLWLKCSTKTQNFHFLLKVQKSIIFVFFCFYI